MTDQIEVILGALNQFTERQVKRIALNLDANLRESTPVDTGWARANWILKIGGPSEGTAGTRAEAESGHIDSTPQDAGVLAVAAGYKLGPPIYETNNVPYIGKLNAGSSTQAPAAFVQGAIVRAVEQTVARPG